MKYKGGGNHFKSKISCSRNGYRCRQPAPLSEK
jgi:hypothetical protein